ncbi:Uncharacterised protein [Vibrio cholerae]|uniref:Uncharacterized protein n=1 Tax=Vibrio cholerae TaxID=666 RepID=A0A655Z731_VIBCL|nr:Uncharacterised protein [Vibrio cholerae]
MFNTAWQANGEHISCGQPSRFELPHHALNLLTQLSIREGLFAADHSGFILCTGKQLLR